MAEPTTEVRQWKPAGESFSLDRCLAQLALELSTAPLQISIVKEIRNGVAGRALVITVLSNQL